MKSKNKFLQKVKESLEQVKEFINRYTDERFIITVTFRVALIGHAGHFLVDTVIIPYVIPSSNLIA